VKEYVKSSPSFFRLIKGCLGIVLVSLAVLALVIPAPLQEPASLAKVPNPAKSAWFLLWIQELVSYSKYLIYPAAAAGLFFFVLPWLVPPEPAATARWFPRNRCVVNILTLAVFAAIVLLTIIAMFFRGADWSLIACR
jgi:hypothetical protein